MAVDIPQGDGGRAETEDSARPERPGNYTGQQVIKDGYVWDYDPRHPGDGWSRMREATDDDYKTIPRARVGLDEGFDYNRWRNRNVESDVPDSSDNNNDGGNNNGGGGGGGGGNDTVGIGAGDGKDTLRGLPDGGKIWKVGEDYYVVYTVPNSQPPVRLSYKFRNKEEAASVSAGKGIDVDRTLTREEFRDANHVPSGQASLITNTDEHPFDRFRQDFDREVRFKPWLADPDFMALIARSILEGREPSLAEIQETEWYQNHSAVERQKLELYYGDREEWRAQREAAEETIRSAMEAAGYSGGSKGRVADYLSRELMFGRIRDEAQLAREIEALSNPLANGAKRSAGFDKPQEGWAVNIDGEIFWRVKRDGELIDYRMTAVEEAKYGADAKKVKGDVHGGGGEGRKGFGNLLRADGGADFVGAVDGFEATRQWIRQQIGPALMQGLTQRQIAEYAQRIDENPEAKDEIAEKFRKMRAAKYPGYDPNLTYDEIATVPRAQFQQMWGRRVNEKNPLFQWAINQNDETEVAKRLWSEGLDRGVEKVTNEALSQLSQSMGGGVRRSMV